MGRTKGSKNGFRKVPIKKPLKIQKQKSSVKQVNTLKMTDDDPVKKATKVKQTSLDLPFFEPYILEVYRQKDYTKCIHLINEILENGEDEENKNHYKILQAGAHTMLREDFNKAHSLLDEVLASDPSNSHAMYNKGVAFYFEKKFIESIEILSKAIEVCPEGMERATDMVQRIDLESRKAVIMVHKMSHEYEMPEDLAENSDDQLPDPQHEDLEIFNDTNASDIPENQFIAIDDTAKIKPKVKQTMESSRISNVSSSPKPESVIEEINEPSHPPETCIKSCSPKPITSTEFFAKGNELFLSGSLKKALRMFNKALKLDPDMTKAEEMGEKTQDLLELIDVAEMNMNQKNFWAVVEILNEGLEISGTSDHIKAPFYYQRGLALFHLGKNEESMKDYAEFDRINKKLTKK